MAFQCNIPGCYVRLRPGAFKQHLRRAHAHPDLNPVLKCDQCDYVRYYLAELLYPDITKATALNQGNLNLVFVILLLIRTHELVNISRSMSSGHTASKKLNVHAVQSP